MYCVFLGFFCLCKYVLSIRVYAGSFWVNRPKLSQGPPSRRVQSVYTCDSLVCCGGHVRVTYRALLEKMLLPNVAVLEHLECCCPCGHTYSHVRIMCNRITVLTGGRNVVSREEHHSTDSHVRKGSSDLN
jgi:hypothetical protein